MIIEILPYVVLFALIATMIYVFDEKYSLLSKLKSLFENVYYRSVENKKETFLIIIGVFLIVFLLFSSNNAIEMFSEINEIDNKTNQAELAYSTLTEQILFYSPANLDSPLFLFSHNDPSPLRAADNIQYGHLDVKLGSVFATVTSELPTETVILEPFQEFENITKIQFSYYFLVINSKDDVLFEDFGTHEFNSTSEDTYSNDIYWDPKKPDNLEGEIQEERIYEVIKSVYVSYTFPNGTYEFLSTGSPFIRWSFHNPYYLTTLGQLDPNMNIIWTNDTLLRNQILYQIIPILFAIIIYVILVYREFWSKDPSNDE